MFISIKTSLTPPLFIEVPVPSREHRRLCICVLWYRLCPFLRFYNWILNLFRYYNISYFSFHFSVRFSARILEIVTSSNFTIIKLKYQLGPATVNVYMK